MGAIQDSDIVAKWKTYRKLWSLRKHDA